jgi:acyl-coenzyme A thioesterase PaaI-like protein
LLVRGGTAAAGVAAAAGARFAAGALLGGTTAAVALNSQADRRDVSTAAAAQQNSDGGAFAAPSSSSSGDGAGGRGDGVAASAWGQRRRNGNASSSTPSTTTGRESDSLPWVRALAESEGVREVPLPGQMLRDHPIGRLVSEPDHLLANMVSTGQMREFRCFYDEKRRLFHSVVLLGRDVAGYPSTLHGGATAAFVDETLGGLYTSLLAGGKLGATLPGLTKRLEVDYKRTAPTGGALHITAEVESVEPRKVWMRASVKDGATGAEYATGRALFVAPHLGRMILRALGLPGPGGRAGASELGSGGSGSSGSAATGSGSKPRPPSSPIGGKTKSEPPEEGGW